MPPVSRFTGPSDSVSGDLTSVSVHWLRVLLQGFASMGLDAGEIQRRSGIQESELKAPDGRIDLARTLLLWRAAEEVQPECSTGSRPLGLYLGNYLTPLHFPLLAMNLMHCRDLMDALSTAGRYSSVISQGGSFSLSPRETEVTLRYKPGSEGFSRHQIDTVLLLIKRFGEWLFCRNITPVRVRLAYPVPPESEWEFYLQQYGSMPEFDCEAHELVLARSWFELPLPGGDPALADMHARLLDEKLQRINHPDIQIQVERILMEAVHLGIGREDLASQLHMSESTLQRRLGEAGTTFQNLLDTERRRRAEQLLALTQLPLIDISQLLGFADNSAFSRAFRRWQGVSPLQYRQQSQI